MKPLYTSPLLRTSRPYICRNCLLSRTSSPATQSHITSPRSRQYATSSPPPAPPKAGYARLSSRRLISIAGPDATKYLQGVITANVSPSPSIPRGSGFYAAFLNAKGRMLNDVFVYPDRAGLGPRVGGAVVGGAKARWSGGEGNGDAWLIEVDAKEVEALAKHVKKYRVSAKFDIRILGDGSVEGEEGLGIWSVWGEAKKGGEGADGEWTAHSLAGSPASTSSPSSSPFPTSDTSISCPDTRAPGMGRRLLLPSTTARPELDLDPSTEDAYRIRRYLKGVPEGQDELIKEHALPQESNLDFMGGVDYRKGCYVGQELTIRTHHTGVVRKRILPVVLYGAGEKAPDVLAYEGDAVDAKVDASAIPQGTSFERVDKRGRSAGKWLAGVGNVGLGLCRLEIMTGLQIAGGASGEGGGGWKEGDEFKCEWEGEDGEGQMVKVKAFVPGWHLKR